MENEKMLLYCGTKLIKAMPQEKEGKPGYLVEYKDGGQCWIAKDEFEKTYHRTDYDENELIQKLIVEFTELNNKEKKLEAFFNTESYKNFSPEMQYLMDNQYHAMCIYRNALNERIHALQNSEDIG